ncbi:immunoglobulin-like domain-containing protein [Enterococcus faecalis]|uniref:immunoglobulin-like domain-containing protein n=1 Tax=Enterococcus faecalis TaxID=1351 RepID=UPI00254CAF22|nr:immunoglobulin-like domain-containing protein [Enterococcus faecalis]MDV2508264.1 immunoglobulin-like domain-containing protein [Enterococcus faecalis]MDZ3791653.1 immunoglobulin-like domain-containing protein [Enterococcus faecalis]
MAKRAMNALAADGETTYQLSAKDYTIGDSEVTGVYDNEKAVTIKLFVEDVAVDEITPDNSKNIYAISTSKTTIVKDSKVEVAEYDADKNELTKILVTVIDPNGGGNEMDEKEKIDKFISRKLTVLNEKDGIVYEQLAIRVIQVNQK